MGHIVLRNVSLEFPVFDVQRSLRRTLFSLHTGGSFRRTGYKKRKLSVSALSDINLDLMPGDRLGIIGPNGAGKTTLLKVMAGIYPVLEGKIFVDGIVSPIFSTSLGMDTDDTGMQNIITIGMTLGMTHEEVRSKAGAIAEFSQLGDFLSLPVRTYSSGMQLRLSFAIATAIDPGILLLDEGLGAGDARFAEQAKRRMAELVEKSTALVIASHSEAMIENMCNKAILLDSGKIIAEGPVDEVLDAYDEFNHRVQ